MQLIHQKQQKLTKRIFFKLKRKEIKKRNTFKSKREEIKKSLVNSLKKNIFKSKRKEIKKSLMKPSKKKILKSKMKEIKEILYDSILDKDEKIEEIKKIDYSPKKNLFKPKKDSYKPIRIGNAFSSNYIEYKSNGDKDKTLSIKDYLDEIKQYLSDMINNNETQGEWKIHLTMAINLFFSKDSEEIRTMHSKVILFYKYIKKD